MSNFKLSIPLLILIVTDIVDCGIGNSSNVHDGACSILDLQGEVEIINSAHWLHQAPAIAEGENVTFTCPQSGLGSPTGVAVCEEGGHWRLEPPELMCKTPSSYTTSDEDDYGGARSFPDKVPPGVTNFRLVWISLFGMKISWDWNGKSPLGLDIDAVSFKVNCQRVGYSVAQTIVTVQKSYEFDNLAPGIYKLWVTPTYKGQEAYIEGPPSKQLTLGIKGPLKHFSSDDTSVLTNRSCVLPRIEVGGWFDRLLPLSRTDDDNENIFPTTIDGTAESGSIYQFRCNPGYHLPPQVKEGNKFECGPGGWAPDIPDLAAGRRQMLLDNKLAKLSAPSTLFCIMQQEPSLTMPIAPKVAAAEDYDYLSSETDGKLCPRIRLTDDHIVVKYIRNNYPLLSSSQSFRRRFSMIGYMAGDKAKLECSVGQLPLGPPSMRECLSSGIWTDSPIPQCAMREGCVRVHVEGNRRHFYQSADCSRSGSEDCIFENGDVVLSGTDVFFECADSSSYYLEGEQAFACTSGNVWSPLSMYFPKCLRKKNCTAMEFPANGYYTAARDRLMFVPGEVVEFGCANGFTLRGSDQSKCLPNGKWSQTIPSCARVEYHSKRLIALIAVASLLGLLMITLLVFLVQRQVWLRKLGRPHRRRLLDLPSEPYLTGAMTPVPPHSLGPSSISYSIGSGSGSGLSAGAARVPPDVHPDRLALIAFAEGIDSPLPSYEEAVGSRRSTPAFDAISTISGYANRLGRRLPSLSSLWSRETVGGASSSTDGYHQPLIGSASSSEGQPANHDQLGSSGLACSSVACGIRNTGVDLVASWETLGAISEGSDGTTRTGTSGDTATTNSSARTGGTGGSVRAQAGSIEGSVSSLPVPMPSDHQHPPPSTSFYSAQNDPGIPVGRSSGNGFSLNHEAVIEYNGYSSGPSGGRFSNDENSRIANSTTTATPTSTITTTTTNNNIINNNNNSSSHYNNDNFSHFDISAHRRRSPVVEAYERYIDCEEAVEEYRPSSFDEPPPPYSPPSAPGLYGGQHGSSQTQPPTSDTALVAATNTLPAVISTTFANADGIVEMGSQADAVISGHVVDSVHVPEVLSAEFCAPDDGQDSRAVDPFPATA